MIMMANVMERSPADFAFMAIQLPLMGCQLQAIIVSIRLIRKYLSDDNYICDHI